MENHHGADLKIRFTEAFSSSIGKPGVKKGKYHSHSINQNSNIILAIAQLLSYRVCVTLTALCRAILSTVSWPLVGYRYLCYMN